MKEASSCQEKCLGVHEDKRDTGSDIEGYVWCTSSIPPIIPRKENIALGLALPIFNLRSWRPIKGMELLLVDCVSFNQNLIWLTDAVMKAFFSLEGKRLLSFSPPTIFPIESLSIVSSVSIFSLFLVRFLWLFSSWSGNENCISWARCNINQTAVTLENQPSSPSSFGLKCYDTK